MSDIAARPAVNARVVEIARQLIRFDTTNPPGNERACIEYIAELIHGAGLEPQIVAKDGQRPNLVVRLAGQRPDIGLLMHGHVDVVPTTGQPWDVAPFEARIIDNALWGRGALDMKGGLAMMLEALLRLRDNNIRPPHDIVFAAFADQEEGSEFGATHVLENRPELFDGVRYAIGEMGGFSTTVSGRRFYPIAVCEKQWCTLTVTVHGTPGHGSVPVQGGAMPKLAHVLTRLAAQRLPVHVTPTAHDMVTCIADQLPLPQRMALQGLLRPILTDRLLGIGGRELAAFDAMLHNTVNPTRIHASTRVDAVPAAITVDLDGRVLPGHTAAELADEVQHVCGTDATVELTEVYETAGPVDDYGIYNSLAQAITDIDPEARPVPFILPGCTDARFLARLAIQGYGYLPMKLPDGFNPAELIHAPNERIPLTALQFGADVIERLLCAPLGQ
jgi:acetylornithine deacetylase/succinyl-diaminopimelate desuccinylase-like protein